MKPTDEERREVAARLRESRSFVDGLGKCGMTQNALDTFERILECIGYETGNVFDFLADLIEPDPERTCRAEVLRFREDDDSQSACLVCSACGEKLRYREAAADDGEPDYELLPYCAGCGARVEGADEVAEHAQACGTCGSFRRCCECGSGWCMELMRPVRDDEAACEEHDPARP